MPSPINKQDLCIPGAINKSHLSLFLYVTNRDISSIDEPCGINYQSRFQGGIYGLGFPNTKGNIKHFSKHRMKFHLRDQWPMRVQSLPGSDAA